MRRAAALPLVLLITAFTAGCASSERRFAAPDHARLDGDWEDERVTEPDPTIVRRATFRGPDGAYEVGYDEKGRAFVPQAPVKTIAPAPQRPKPVGRRTIHLQQARLDNALRAIAEAGRFNLLVEGDLARPVSAKLVGVEPYEALVALAGANGALVHYDGSIVVVSRQ